MTRIQVLKRARRLLERGFLRLGIGSNCQTAEGVEVSDSHPDAARFNIFTAINRAVYEETGDHYSKRQQLWESATDPVLRHLGGTSAAFRTLRNCDKDAVLLIIDHILEEWDAGYKR